MRLARECFKQTAANYRGVRMIPLITLTKALLYVQNSLYVKFKYWR